MEKLMLVRSAALLLFIVLIYTSSARSEGRQENSVTTITPIYSQLLMVSLPQGFKIVFENTKGSHYIREAVPEGESTDSWTQMITVTGAQNLVANPNLSPKKIAEIMAGGFKRSCPDSFRADTIAVEKISGNDAFIGTMSCGISPTPPAGQMSESAVVAVIKGERDYYTIQWAERGNPSKTPIKLDTKKMTDRFKQLAPIKLCPIIPGEPPPYSSCIESKTTEATQRQPQPF